MADAIKGGVAQQVLHDSAAKHVMGTAVYIDDMREPDDLLHVYFGGSAEAHAKILPVDLSAVAAAPGVVAVLTAQDIPGTNDVSPTPTHDDPVFADAVAEYAGQPIFAVAAESRDAARRAVRLADITYEALPAALDIEAARKIGVCVTPPHELRRGDPAPAIADAPHRITARMEIGGQDHFYLEGQIAYAVPGEADELTVYSSSQHPSEVQSAVAEVMGLPKAAIVVETRRMGGGFGGKESQANIFAATAAMVAARTGRPAKIRPDRDEDMRITGKRHDFVADYDVGFDDDGRILGVDVQFAGRCGFSADLSSSINDRALFHTDNCYYLPNASIKSMPLKTNTVSNTAFRGFGGPQGMLAGERMIEEIAFALGKDPLDIRKANFYGGPGRDITPYHQQVADNVIADIVDQLEADADYAARRLAIRAENAKNKWQKKGIALTPVKFGISFTATHLNQAGALIHIYTDGSIHLNHGGTEMGQGLMTKVAQVVAEEFQIDLDYVRITATSTGKVPNTSPTAASSGADLNGKAAQAAAQTLKARLIGFAADHYDVPKEQIAFLANRVRIGNQEVPFPELINEAYMARVSLSSTGFYKTPKIYYDREKARGHPFYYFAYGAAVSEVTVDTLTGEYRVDRVDILHDVGRSLNPAIDLGQIEGGFIQGMGWLTTEELVWTADGHLATHAPSTYKIPACSDRPPDFRMRLLEGAANSEDTVYSSKAVGEPPLMLAISVLHALSDAVASVADYRHCPRLDPPATPEKVLAAIMNLQGKEHA